jgi:hypothetical protein
MEITDSFLTLQQNFTLEEEPSGATVRGCSKDRGSS